MPSETGPISDLEEVKKARRDDPTKFSHRLIFKVNGKLMSTFDLKTYAWLKNGEEVTTTYIEKPLSGGKSTNEVVNVVCVPLDGEGEDILPSSEEAKPKQEFKQANKFVDGQRLGLCCNLVSRTDLFRSSKMQQEAFKKNVKGLYKTIEEIEIELEQTE